MPKFKLGKSSARTLIAQHAFALMCNQAAEDGVVLSARDMEAIRNSMLEAMESGHETNRRLPGSTAQFELNPEAANNHCGYYTGLFLDGISGQRPDAARVVRSSDFARKMDLAVRRAQAEFTGFYNQGQILVNALGMSDDEIYASNVAGYGGFANRAIQSVGDNRGSPFMMVPVDPGFMTRQDVPANALLVEDDTVQTKGWTAMSFHEAMADAQVLPVTLSGPDANGVRLDYEQAVPADLAARWAYMDRNNHPELHMTANAYQFYKAQYAFSRMLAATEQSTGRQLDEGATKAFFERMEATLGTQGGLPAGDHRNLGSVKLSREFYGNMAPTTLDEERFLRAFSEASHQVFGTFSDEGAYSDMMRRVMTESLDEFDVSIMNPERPVLLYAPRGVEGTILTSEAFGSGPNFDGDAQGDGETRVTGRDYVAVDLAGSYGMNVLHIEQLDGPMLGGIDAMEDVHRMSLTRYGADYAVDAIRANAGLAPADPIVSLSSETEAERARRIEAERAEAERIRQAEAAAAEAERVRQEEAERARQDVQFEEYPFEEYPYGGEYDAPFMGDGAALAEQEYAAMAAAMEMAGGIDEASLYGGYMEEPVPESEPEPVRAEPDVDRLMTPHVYRNWKSQYAFARMMDAYAQRSGADISAEDAVRIRSEVISSLRRMPISTPVVQGGSVFGRMVLAGDGFAGSTATDNRAFVDAMMARLPGVQADDAAMRELLSSTLSKSVGEFDTMLTRRPENPVLLLNGMGMQEGVRKTINAIEAAHDAADGPAYMGAVLRNAPGRLRMSYEPESDGMSMQDGLNATGVYAFDVDRMAAGATRPVVAPVRAASSQQPSRQASGQQPGVAPRVETLSTIGLERARIDEKSTVNIFQLAKNGENYEFTPEGRAQMDYFIRQNCYHDLIQRMNASLAERGLDISNGVTTRTASMMLDQVQGFDQMHPRDLPAALSKVIDGLPSEDYVKALWKDTLASVTGGDKSDWWRESRDMFENNLVYRGVLTLSPFDTNFRNRKVAMDSGHNALYVRYNQRSTEPLPKLVGSLRGDDLTKYFGNQWEIHDFKYDWETDEELKDALASAEVDINSFSFDERAEFSNPDITKNPLFTQVWARRADHFDQNGNPIYMTENEMRRKVKFSRRMNRGRPETLLTDAEDLSGLAALRPYMSPKDYQALSTATYGNRPWCSACMTTDAEGNLVPKYMSPEAIERVRRTVDMLAASGEVFSFAPDTNPGQVCIKFENGMTMRVIDPANEDFACNHVYHQGAYMHYQVQGASERGYAYPDVTPEMSVDLVRFARGEAVKRRKEGKLNLEEHVTEIGGTHLSDVLGVPGTVRTKDAYSSNPEARGAGTLRQTSYTNTNGTSLNVLVDVLELGKSTASEQPSPDKALVIACDYSNRSASHMTFEDVYYEERLSMGETFTRFS